MDIEYLTQPMVKKIIFQLKWGDRFESNLRSSLETLTGDSDSHFSELRNCLVEKGLVFRLRGEDGNFYLALTDKGQAIADRLVEIESILERE